MLLLWNENFKLGKYIHIFITKQFSVPKFTVISHIYIPWEQAPVSHAYFVFLTALLAYLINGHLTKVQITFHTNNLLHSHMRAYVYASTQLIVILYGQIFIPLILKRTSRVPTIIIIKSKSDENKITNANKSAQLTHTHTYICTYIYKKLVNRS